MGFRKKYILFVTLFMLSVLSGACRKNDGASEEMIEKVTDERMTVESREAEQEPLEQWEKGYNLPVAGRESEEAGIDCKKMMECISDVYKQAEKESSNVVLKDATLYEMQSRIKETGHPVAISAAYSNMQNYERVDCFLTSCLDGKSGSVVIYEILSDGGIERNKYVFNGKEMYVLAAGAVWNADDEPEMSYVSYTRIREWKYTDKGWFRYELCVPEPPEVTEIVDGSCLVRIKPMTVEQQEMSRKYVSGIGYQGNNLLCSNWDTDHMEELDYNGLYEYLYQMKYGKKFSSKKYPKGIPKEEFENLIMKYLPVTAKQIRKYAVFDEKKQTYAWVRLGCFNYVPTFFDTSLPEVTDIKENEDGTITLLVDAVCEMELCDDAVITHELTIRFAEDGNFQYVSNKILNNGIKNIPNYQYRICVE